MLLGVSLKWEKLFPVHDAPVDAKKPKIPRRECQHENSSKPPGAKMAPKNPAFVSQTVTSLILDITLIDSWKFYEYYLTYHKMSCVPAVQPSICANVHNPNGQNKLVAHRPLCYKISARRNPQRNLSGAIQPFKVRSMMNFNVTLEDHESFTQFFWIPLSLLKKIRELNNQTNSWTSKKKWHLQSLEITAVNPSRHETMYFIDLLIGDILQPVEIGNGATWVRTSYMRFKSEVQKSKVKTCNFKNATQKMILTYFEIIPRSLQFAESTYLLNQTENDVEAMVLDGSLAESSLTGYRYRVSTFLIISWILLFSYFG